MELQNDNDTNMIKLRNWKNYKNDESSKMLKLKPWWGYKKERLYEKDVVRTYHPFLLPHDPNIARHAILQSDQMNLAPWLKCQYFLL